MSFWTRITQASKEAEVAQAVRSSGRWLIRERSHAEHSRIAATLEAPPALQDLPMPERVPAEPSPYADVLDEYEALASAVGFAPKALEQEKLRGALAEMGLYVYERAKVEDFLTSKFGQAKKTEVGESATWCWRPMREADRAEDADGHFIYLSANGVVSIYGAAYHKAIPMPVLRTVHRVLAKIPGAKFFVSDGTTLAERFRDPFLAVQLPSSDELVVIERWDEPSFRG